MILSSKGKTLIVEESVEPAKLQLEEDVTLVLASPLNVKAKKDIKIEFKFGADEDVKIIKVETDNDYEKIEISKDLNQDSFNKEIAAKKEAKEIIEEIKSLGNISLESKDKVESIRNRYNKLNSKHKELVTNLAKLEEAEEEIKKLEEAKEAKEEKERQDNIVKETLGKISKVDSLDALEKIEIDSTLSEENRNILVDAKNSKKEELEKIQADKEAAKNVSDAIEGLDNISLESKELVSKVRESYESLTEDQKAYVNNLAKLEQAETKIEELEEAKKEKERQDKIVKETLEEISKVDSLDALEKIKIDSTLSEENRSTLIDAKNSKKEELEKIQADKEAAKNVSDAIEELDNISLESKELVSKVRESYESLTEDQKVYVSNLDKLEQAETKIEKLIEDSLADLAKNMDEFESTVISLLNQQGRFRLEKVNQNELNFTFLTNGNPGGILGFTHDKSPATKDTSMRNYTRSSGLATVLGQKSDASGKAQKARIERMEKYLDMNTAMIDGKKFSGLTSMSKIYSMKVGDLLGSKVGRVKVKDELGEDLYLEYKINFLLTEKK